MMVYESPFPKMRLGRDQDGGYVVCDVPNGYDRLVSAGLYNDSSFEDDWLGKYGGECYAFDGTISRSPSQKIRWIRKNVGTENDEKTDDLSESIRGRTFLKMDIEGDEIPWILHTNRLDDVIQMVVEFHHQPFSPKHEAAFKKINATHVLVHLHGNNHSSTCIHEGVVFPITFECTYLHKSLVPNPSPNSSPLPSIHDKPNNQGAKDISLNHPPFVQNA